MKRIIVGLLFFATLLFGWGSGQVNYNSNYGNQPKYGVEINPFRLIVLSSSWKSVSGTFSIFDYVNNAEIAFPILYSSEESDSGYDNLNSAHDNFKLLTVDMQYRKFLYERVGGLYVSGVARVAILDGRLEPSKIEDDGDNYAKVTKFGVGLGIGYRLLPQYNNWYWGVGLVVGRYLGSDNNIFDSSSLGAIDDSSVFVDLELLKIGYKF